jgi:hypothetical protein
MASCGVKYASSITKGGEWSEEGATISEFQPHQTAKMTYMSVQLFFPEPKIPSIRKKGLEGFAI